MHLTAKHLTAVAGIATALIMAASQANAQTATFTLPYSARVGKTTLPAGEYRLRVHATGTAIPAAYLYSNGKLVASAGVLRQLTPDADGSYLELLAIGDSHYLSKFVSRDTGAIFTFAIPRAARHQVLADTRVTRVSSEHTEAN